MKNKYGICDRCHEELQPIFFEEKETKIAYGYPYETGRTRIAVSHLVCPRCLKSFCVDDSFDGPWK